MKYHWRIILLALALLLSVQCRAETVGVTATEVRIGGVFPFSGPASSFGLIGTGLMAYVKSINERGGINGRKIDYIALDDAYSPPKTVEQVRRLVEKDEVAFIFGQLGTPGNSAVAKYLVSQKVPSIAIVSGASKFSRIADFPLTTTAIVSYETEGLIYAKYLASIEPTAKIALLYQNDDMGKDYLNAFRTFFGPEFELRVVAIPYEVTAPTIESEISRLKSTGAKALVIAGSPKFAAQAIRRAAEIGWDAVRILNFPSSSVGGTLKPAGLENSVGVVTAAITKDTSDPRWNEDAGMVEYRNFFEKYLPGGDVVNGNYLIGFQQGKILELILTQCGDDLSRENILKQARSLQNVQLPVTLPGIVLNSSTGDNMMLRQLQLQRWVGTKWEEFGGVVEAGQR